MEFYHVDAFCKDVFSGNPAGVCIMDQWIADELMQNIAAENNLAETAFCVKENDVYHIRWFTPSVEVDLCGHATMATAHVLFEHKNIEAGVISFTSKSGELKVSRTIKMLTLDFPADESKEIAITHEMNQWFDKKPLEAYKGKTDYLLIFSSEEEIKNMVPNLPAIEKLKDVRGVIVSAKADYVDFVSRFFAPQSGIPEDPVTGSAHTTLAPYWSKKLNRNAFNALQLSPRKGYLQCRYEGARVKISGIAKTYLKGEIFI
jgi:PhzF family phenazine biosynthesis protein